MSDLNLTKIIELIRADRITIIEHASDEAADDELSLADVYFSLEGGEIIERYPMRKPYPRVLVLGFAPDGSPVHTVWAYNPDDDWIDLVTVYRPDPSRWIKWRYRI